MISPAPLQLQKNESSVSAVQKREQISLEVQADFFLTYTDCPKVPQQKGHSFLRYHFSILHVGCINGFSLYRVSLLIQQIHHKLRFRFHQLLWPLFCFYKLQCSFSQQSSFSVTAAECFWEQTESLAATKHRFLISVWVILFHFEREALSFWSASFVPLGWNDVPKTSVKLLRVTRRTQRTAEIEQWHFQRNLPFKERDKSSFLICDLFLDLSLSHPGMSSAD